ncbi:hypothetical protein BDZ89DRAFT_1071027 [Hymenopellis radicata]|nr:hypothetical protein BDZ89DRAFT_1071027 [Hymenopellis radicata]
MHSPRRAGQHEPTGMELEEHGYHTHASPNKSGSQLLALTPTTSPLPLHRPTAQSFEELNIYPLLQLHSAHKGLEAGNRIPGPCSVPHCLFVQLLFSLLSTVTYPSHWLGAVDTKRAFDSIPRNVCYQLNRARNSLHSRLEAIYYEQGRLPLIIHPVLCMSRRRRNNLAHLPLETLTDIVKFLHPRDILRLIRTNHETRDFFLRDSALSIWKASISNLPGPPFPGFPRGINPASWLALLFSENCTFCGNPSAENAIKRDLLLRVVCCPNCYRSELATLEELEALFPPETFGDDTVAEIMATLPTSYRIFKTLGEEPIVEHVCVLRDFRKTLDLVLPLAEDDRQSLLLTRLMQHVNVSATQEAEKADRWRQLHIVAEFGDVLYMREGRVQARLDKVFAKMSTLGYGSEVEIFKESPAMKSRFDPRTVHVAYMSDHELALLESDMVAFMKKERVLRLERERKHALQMRMDDLREAVILPSKLRWIGQKLLVPPMSDILTFPMPLLLGQHSWGLDRDPTIEEALALYDDEAPFDITSFPIQSLFDQLDAGQAAWADMARRELVETAYEGEEPAPLGSPNNFFASLLPSKVLNCKACGEPVFYPEIIFHRCHPEKGWTSGPVPECPNSWSITRFEICEETRRLVSDVIDLFGLDPATATVLDLDRLDLFIWCNSPGNLLRRPRTVFRTGQRFYGWRAFIHTFYEQPIPVRTAMQNKKIRTIACAAPELQQIAYHDTHLCQQFFHCIPCLKESGTYYGEIGMGWSQFKEHFCEEHPEEMNDDETFRSRHEFYIPGSYFPPLSTCRVKLAV